MRCIKEMCRSALLHKPASSARGGRQRRPGLKWDAIRLEWGWSLLELTFELLDLTPLTVCQHLGLTIELLLKNLRSHEGIVVGQAPAVETREVDIGADCLPLRLIACPLGSAGLSPEQRDAE